MQMKWLQRCYLKTWWLCLRETACCPNLLLSIRISGQEMSWIDSFHFHNIHSLSMRWNVIVCFWAIIAFRHSLRQIVDNLTTGEGLMRRKFAFTVYYKHRPNKTLAVHNESATYSFNKSFGLLDFPIVGDVWKKIPLICLFPWKIPDNKADKWEIFWNDIA